MMMGMVIYYGNFLLATKDSTPTYFQQRNLLGDENDHLKKRLNDVQTIF